MCSTFLADAPLGTRRAGARAAHVALPPAGRPTCPRSWSARARASRRSSASSPTAPRAGHTGRNWLFFGEQHQATDFYYRDELSRLLSEGTLDRLATAFSRDQRAKVYVQDRMREHGARLWEWLEQGASFYVCGDASRMAKDVDAALREIVATHGGLSADAADAYVKDLSTTRRYVRDVY